MAELCCCCCMSGVDVSCLLRPWLCCLVELPRGVKDSLHELGCVDEHGMNLTELDAVPWRTLLCPWKRCVCTSQLGSTTMQRSS